MVVKRTNLKRVNRMSEEQRLEEAKKLFPAAIDEVRDRVRRTEKERPFIVEELQKSLDRVKEGKAPGPDGILPEIAKTAVQCQQELYLNVANKALLNEEFPKQSKEAKLVLIGKIGRSSTNVKT